MRAASIVPLLCLFVVRHATALRDPHAIIPRGGGRASTAAQAESPLQIFASTIRQAKRHLIAAAVARSTSIATMYPLDTIKTRIQMGQANAFSATGLFNGVGGSLAGQVPYGVLTFGSYEMYKATLLDRMPQVKPIFTYALAAVLGDLTGSFWLCPSEVVKQKLQAGMFSSTAEAASSIWKSKGLLGFYEGYFGGVARDVPFRVAQLTSYEVSKNTYLRFKRRRLAAQGKKGKQRTVEERLELSALETAVCGAICGSFSAAVTAPLDRIKTLLMTDSAAYGGSVVSCATKIWQKEGLGGFMTGVAPRVVYIAPSVTIFFIAYELVQQRFKRMEDVQ